MIAREEEVLAIEILVAAVLMTGVAQGRCIARCAALAVKIVKSPSDPPAINPFIAASVLKEMAVVAVIHGGFPIGETTPDRKTMTSSNRLAANWIKFWIF